jgi:hypothetical protein
MVSDAGNLDVGGVMLAFTGNYLTPCIQSRPIATGYTDDANWAATFWGAHHIPLGFVAAPGIIGTNRDARTVPNIYASVGASRGVTVAETTPLFALGAPPVYQSDMPCLVGECAGTIEVRRADGHLCPIDSNGNPCPVYASGVVRYVEVMIHGVATMLNLPQPPYRTMVSGTAVVEASPAPAPAVTTPQSTSPTSTTSTSTTSASTTTTSTTPTSTTSTTTTSTTALRH